MNMKFVYAVLVSLALASSALAYEIGDKITFLRSKAHLPMSAEVLEVDPDLIIQLSNGSVEVNPREDQIIQKAAPAEEEADEAPSELTPESQTPADRPPVGQAPVQLPPAVDPLKDVKAGTSGTRLSQNHFDDLVIKFSDLPATTQAVGEAQCVIFAVGSVGRKEGVPGSDLEIGFYCDDLSKLKTPGALKKSVQKDVPGIVLDDEFTIEDHLYDPASTNGKLLLMSPYTLWKLLDATPIAYVNTTAKKFPFDSFVALTLKQLETGSVAEKLVSSMLQNTKSNLIELENEMDGVVVDTTTNETLNGSQALSLDAPVLRELFLVGRSGDYAVATNPIYAIDLKHSLYRPFHFYIAYVYLKFWLAGSLENTTWKASSLDRLNDILAADSEVPWGSNLTACLNTVLTLRTATMITRHSGKLLGSDFDGDKYFKTVPAADAYQLISIATEMWKKPKSKF